MPDINSQIAFRAGIEATFNALATKDPNTIYFCTDSKKIYLGSEEYTKSTVILDVQPTSTTPGDDGRLYAYNGNLYLCQYVDGVTYTWHRVANVNDGGRVASVGAGDGLATTAGTDNPITSTGTIVHAVPEGAQVHEDTTQNQTANFGKSFEIQSVETDKFGHVVAVNIHTVAMPEETTVSVKEQVVEEQTELKYGQTFHVVSQVTKGEGSHEVKSIVKELKLPETLPIEGVSFNYNKETDTVTIS